MRHEDAHTLPSPRGPSPAPRGTVTLTAWMLAGALAPVLLAGCGDINIPASEDASVGADVAACTAGSCADDDPCTLDLCDEATGHCLHAPNPGGACDDGDPCTEGDTCTDQGMCLGTAKACEDANPCTADGCDAATGLCLHAPRVGESCDDGDACTLDDACGADATCAGTPKTCGDATDGPCVEASCDPATGACAVGPKSCDDGNPCTVDLCDPTDGTCLSTPQPGAACDDEDPCTLADTCLGNGQCEGVAKTCDDGDPCTEGTCDPATGACAMEPTAGGACDDGDPCTNGDTCDQAGACVGAPVSCDDGLACSEDSCDAGTGQCVHDMTACSCQDDADCDDGNPCTTASCVTGACASSPAPPGPCDDGNPCTLGDACDGNGACVGTPKDCADAYPCTVDACDTATGQCTHGDAACGCLQDSDCSDGDPCTADTCVSSSGQCDHAPSAGASCDDGDACTTGDVCSSAGACHGTPKPCDDGVSCSVDSCNPATGQCVFDTSGCGCLQDDDCKDGDPCTADSCVASTGHCDHSPATGGACDDGDACTTGDVCSSAGACHGTPKSCSDGIGCTTDTCDPATGQCTSSSATCECSSWMDCGDGNACTNDDCGADYSCTFTPKTGGACTHQGTSGECQAGSCQGVQEVQAGAYFACALTQAGAVRCWGYNEYGELGAGDAMERLDQPGETASNVDLGGVVPLRLAVGASHVCVLTAPSTVRCWGGGSSGGLGNGSTSDLLDGSGESPSTVSFPGESVSAITSGWRKTCVALASGKVRCWGENDSGQLGAGSTSDLMDQPGEQPSTILLSNVTALTSGFRHTCALLGGGTVRCWGSNGNGQLGAGHANNLMDQSNEQPSTVNLDGQSAVAISAGLYHTCALTSAGAVRCWGKNSYGQLGAGHTNDLMDEPGESASTVNLGGAKATAVSAGGYFTCALTTAGAVRCWGANSHGQLGAGHASNLMDGGGESPSTVPLGGHIAVAISAGDDAACALLDSRQVVCWGENEFGQLGYGNTTDVGVAAGQLPVAHYTNVMGAPGSACTTGGQCLGQCAGGGCQ